MSEKQIDLDSMRALAREFEIFRHDVISASVDGAAGKRLLTMFRKAITEIEQLRKDCADYAETKKRDTESYMAMDAGIRELEATVEQLRKERDALAEARDRVGELLAHNGCNGPCAHGSCCVEKACEECHMADEDDWCFACIISAALAAQGDKPHD